jgi:hypothetical protein
MLFFGRHESKDWSDGFSANLASPDFNSAHFGGFYNISRHISLPTVNFQLFKFKIQMRNNVSCLFLAFPLITSSLIIVDWLAACIALRVVGAVLVVHLWRWRKIYTILQPMGNKGRYLKKCPKPR